MAHRTTVTLQDDVYERVTQRAAATGRRVRDVINEAIRRGLADEEDREAVELASFGGDLRIDVTSTSSALDALEGDSHR